MLKIYITSLNSYSHFVQTLMHKFVQNRHNLTYQLTSRTKNAELRVRIA